MFDRYVIAEDGFSNVVVDGEVIGFQLRLCIGYYRGLGLSMIEGFDVTVDGTAYPREANLFQLRGRTFTFTQMETVYDECWEMGEFATLIVPRKGGLEPGQHQITVKEFLRVSYMPVLSTAQDQKTLLLQG